MSQFQTWLYSLVAAVITGAAHSATNYLVDPTCLDTPAGVYKLQKTVVFSIIISLSAYLYKSPLPVQASTIDYSNMQKEQLDNLLKSLQTEVEKRNTPAPIPGK